MLLPFGAASAYGAFESGVFVSLSLAEGFVFAGFLGGIVCEGLALFSDSSAAFAASSTDGVPSN